LVDIDEIKRAIVEDRFDLNNHAVDAMDDDGIWKEDLQMAASSFELLDSEEDERGTRYLVEGQCGKDLSIRLVTTWSSQNRLQVITVYVRRRKRRGSKR
jgi:hypothetical protein